MKFFLLKRQLSNLAAKASVPKVPEVPNVVEDNTIIKPPAPLFLPINENIPESVDPEKFASYTPVDRIKAIFDKHGSKAVQLASMQRTSGALMHLIYRAKADMPILFFDTQYLHQETYDLRDEFVKRYGLRIHSVLPELTPEQQDERYGKDLWKSVEGQPKCCYMRKEKPLVDTLRKLDADCTLSGVMRTQGGARKNIQCVDHDLRLNTITYNPLFDWSNEQLHSYTKENDIPVHKLYTMGYTSIGCKPCTTPVEAGEDDRAGRWRHLRSETGQTHAYCGMNYADMKPKTDVSATAQVVNAAVKKGGYWTKKNKTSEPTTKGGYWTKRNKAAEPTTPAPSMTRPDITPTITLTPQRPDTQHEQTPTPKQPQKNFQRAFSTEATNNSEQHHQIVEPPQSPSPTPPPAY